MEEVSCSSRYWKRKQGRYERLNRPGSQWRRPRLPVATLGAGSPQKKRFRWKLNMKQKLRLLKCLKKPKQFFASLRDGYVRMMLKISDSIYFPDQYGGKGFGHGAVSEYDERLIGEIYKSMVLQAKLKAYTALQPAEAIVGGARSNLLPFPLQ